MGKENTIRTGVSTRNSGRKQSSSFSVESSYLINIGVGRVTKTFPAEGGMIEFESTLNTYGFNKRGYAYPLNPSNYTPPQLRESILLFSTPPGNIDSFNLAEAGSRRTFYVLNTNANGDVNGTFSSEAGTGGFDPSSVQKLTTQEQKNNAVIIKNYLKNKALAPEVAAAIMGNIVVESGYNPTAGWSDVNGKPSVGLIQWNGGAYDISKLPKDVTGQMDFLFNNTPSFKTFLNYVNSTNSSGSNLFGISKTEWFAFIFAEKVEVCSFCSSGWGTYSNGGQVLNKSTGNYITIRPRIRSNNALSIYNQFYTSGDFLQW